MNGGVMKEPLSNRTKAYAVRTIRLYNALPKRGATRVIANQMLRSGTSVGAHTREGFRGRSDAELISKLETALQELDETIYWIELLVETNAMKQRRLDPLLDESNQLMAILVSSVKTIKARRKR
jgi:four helix bundle protein